MYLCKADLNNNTSYENISKLNLQFIYLAFFTFSFWACSYVTNHVPTCTRCASRTHTKLCRTMLLTRIKHNTRRILNIYIRKSTHAMSFTWKSVVSMYFHRQQICIRKFAVWRPCKLIHWFKKREGYRGTKGIREEKKTVNNKLAIEMVHGC